MIGKNPPSLLVRSKICPLKPLPLETCSPRSSEPQSKHQENSPPSNPAPPADPPSNDLIFLFPILVGTVGALSLSLLSPVSFSNRHLSGTLFKLTLIAYSFAGTVTTVIYVYKVVKTSQPGFKTLSLPVAGALALLILYYATAYLLLYRFFPASFRVENIGKHFSSQFFTFLYFSVTTLATADLGDILPRNLTARALITTEIAFNLFVLATGIQLFLASN